MYYNDHMPPHFHAKWADVLYYGFTPAWATTTETSNCENQF